MAEITLKLRDLEDGDVQLTFEVDPEAETEEDMTPALRIGALLVTVFSKLHEPQYGRFLDLNSDMLH